MKPTEELSREHRVIEKVIGALECMAEKAKVDGKVDGEDAGLAIDFIRIFADKCHHGKEEERLFPVMEARGFSIEFGPTAMMRHEHTIGRKFVSDMARSVKGASNGVAGDLREFMEAAQGYCSLLRVHIQKEDEVLYPMVEQTLRGEEKKQLEEEFTRVEELMGKETHEKYSAIAEKLSAKYALKTKKGNHAHFKEGCSICGEGG